MKNLKKHLHKGDYAILIHRIREKYGKEYSRSTIASVLSPNTEHDNELIYCEALKLSVERQEAVQETALLEAKLQKD